jgi:hypothetical protein
VSGDDKPSASNVPVASEAALSDAFAEPDRPTVETIEACIAAGQTRDAILHSAALVDDVLAIGAQDRALAALLVGVSGPEWIRFQNSVAMARSGQSLSPQLAIECFAFALETSARCRHVVGWTEPTL